MVAYPKHLISSAVKLLWTYMSHRQRPRDAEHVGEIAELHIYPVKSMRSVGLKTAECTVRGIKYPDADVFDRNFMIVDSNGAFVHARAEPKLTTVNTSVSDDQIIVECKGLPALKLPIVPPKSSRNVVNSKVWGENVQGQDCGDEAAEWISALLNREGLRMVYGSPELLNRELNKQKDKWKMPAKDGDYVTFQDGFPYMLATVSSLEDLNKRNTDETYIMQRFRPNIVLTGSKAFDEDNWSEIWIGNVKFTNMKPCQRCIFVTIDPMKGVKNENEEPLKTLRKYRLDEPNFGKSPLFGINLVLDSEELSRINVGDPVYVIRKVKDGL